MKTAESPHGYCARSYQKRSNRWRRRALRALALVAATLTVLLAALWALLRIALMPQTGEWATGIGRGPFRLQASVPQLVWLATTPWIGERLHGLRLRTRLGPVTLGWAAPGQEGPDAVLTLHCEPCTLPLPEGALGQASLAVPAARIALSRADVQHLRGTVLLAVAQGGEDAVIGARWQAHRHGAGWRVALQAPPAPVRDWLTLLAPGLPESRTARIEGTLAFAAELRLPERTLQLAPVLEGLSVQGLGTGEWAHARSSCGPHRVHDARGWLARAVLAAEDQRFFEHAGYDLPELLAALAANQRHGAVRRGGSTITQQLAKLMVAGGERSLARKLRELLYAVEMERTLGKARILQLYLNTAPWGETAGGRLVCGADAAARHYFGIPARRLSAGQAVTLAALLRNPRREAAAWARGDVDRQRWVAGQVRGASGRQRQALAAALAAGGPVPVSWPFRAPEDGHDPRHR